MTDNEPSQSPPRKSPWMKLVMALVPLLLLLALLELALWAFDLGDAASLPPASRGFDPETAYLLPTDDGWRTHLYNKLERETVIPAKGAARRVLMVGGSNTEVFPNRYLAELLGERLPHPAGYEVFNMGRAGYGSARVAILLEQALVIEPDVVVIYSGHNEFVERGLALELERMMGGVAGKASQGFQTLRVFRQLEEALRAAAPETRGDIDPTSEVTSYAVTLDIHARYRHNIARMCNASLSAGANVVLCTVVSNDLWPPFLSGPAPETAAQDVSLAEQLQAEALALIPKRLKLGLAPPMRITMGSWFGAPEAPNLSGGLPELRPLLGALADMPATPVEHGNDASIEGRHWPPPSTWSSRVLTVLRTMERANRRPRSEAIRKDLLAAHAKLLQARSLVPVHASILYHLGLVTWLLGDDDAAARDWLHQAQVNDWAPHSGNDVGNVAVRAVAAELPAVRLLDAAQITVERCPAGIVSYEVMMDSCHLQPGARRVLMADMVAPVLERWRR